MTSWVGSLAVDTRHPAPHQGDHREPFYRPLLRDQFDAFRDQLQQQQGLPFLDVLSRARVGGHVPATSTIAGGTAIYTPWITLGIFLSQVLSKDQSCDDAVDRFQKFRYDRNLPSVSPETTSYCEARSRLPEPSSGTSSARSGSRSINKANTSWLFQGRPVKIVDGSTVSMPDTPENQAAYPQAEDPEARRRVPDRSAPGGLQPRRGHGPRGRGRPLSGQADQRTGLASVGHRSIPARRHRPGRSVFLLVLGDRRLAGSRGRRGGAASPTPLGRLPPRASPGPRGPSRHLAETPAGRPTG